jgi:predicted O-linked N-acetylglucosamine transferase (SPINDLY family)
MSIEGPQQSRIDSIISLVSNSQFNEALDEVSRLILEHPNESLLFNITGACYAGLGKFEDAIQFYEKAIAINPRYAKAHYNLAGTHHELDQINKALESYKEAIKIDPSYAEAHNNIGNLFVEIDQLDHAIDSFQKAVALSPQYLEAHYSLSIVFQNLGQFKNMASHLNEVIAIKPDFSEAHNNLGIALKELGQLDNSVESYKRALTIKPDYLEAHNNLGNVLKELGQFEEAIQSYKEALLIEPDYPVLHNNLGNVLKELGRFDDAIKSYEKAIDSDLNNLESYNNLGNILVDQGQILDAVKYFEKALAINPNYFDALNNLGIALKKLGNINEAVECFEKALAINPNYFDALNNLGITLNILGQLERAIVSYKKAIKINPLDVDTLNNIGISLMNSGDSKEAIKYFKKAIALDPKYADAFNNLSIAFIKLKKLDKAFKSNSKALSLKSDFAEAYAIRGRIYTDLKQLNEALANFEKANKINPNLAYNLGSILNTKMNLCNWSKLTSTLDELKYRLLNNQKVIIPFDLLGLIDDPKLQKKASEIYANDNFPENHSLPKLERYPKHSKIRIGYFSADFKMHPVATLTAELYETHDRSQFEIHAFSFGPDNNDEMNLRIKAGVDHFHEVSSKSDKDIALLARSLEIDIAVDLGGYTADSRTGIFAMRAAPIQSSYIGVLSTMGSSYYDYIFAGSGMIPSENQKYFSEKIIYLPSYQVNDSKELRPDIKFNRADFELSNKGFVFCCFNNTYKITPGVLDSWAKILNKVNESSLIIYTDSEDAKTNLTKEIISRGVNTKRVIFAKSLPRPEYLARFKVADLFLDTRPYNAGTTASDALRMGLPVLTMQGNSFNSREASGILTALNLPELIMSTPKEYEQMAIKLATDSQKFEKIKIKLEANLSKAPLYDTKLFTSNLESAYKLIYKHYQLNTDLDHIIIQ